VSAVVPHESARGTSQPIPKLDALPVLVIDAQATGASPKYGELLEIGWAIAEPGRTDVEVHTHWLSLSPGTRVTRVVRELTGYDDALALSAISPRAAWDALLTAARTLPRTASGGVPTVIHFARFETSFLHEWHARFSREDALDAPFPFDVVCLHALARRLYPTLPRSGLRALAGFLGHTTSLIRRADGHVEASAHVWRRSVEALGERGVVDWSSIAAIERAPAIRAKKPAFPMDVRIRRAVPNGPGVYRFLRSNGDVLYVGKAANIRKRIASHFSGAARTGERAMEMLTQALAIDTTETPTTLEAALLECDEVKRIDPPYNVQLREATLDAWFLDRGLGTATRAPDDEHPIGPLPSRLAVTGFGAVRQIVMGTERSPLLRARAVGTPIAFAPEEAAFDEGWRLFLERYVLHGAPLRRGSLLLLARRLRDLHKDGALDEGPDEAAPMSERTWDAARVARHLERAVLSGGGLLRRARWLVILSDAIVTYEEAGRPRELVVQGGDIVSARDIGTVTRSADGPKKPWRARQAVFDGARYDRLRVLTTELRRVLDEGGQATAYVAGGARLDGTALRRLLAYV
jgi:DNA polymerase-3 subunit epsilon